MTPPLLDRFMPTPDVKERHEILVRAPGPMVFETAANFDLQSIPLVRGIFWLRSKLLGGATYRRIPQGLLGEMTDLGWGILGSAPGRELVAGAVTEPWKPNPTFKAIPSEQFAAFADPGLVKIAWTLEAEPLGDSVTKLGTETRAVATDPRSRQRFRRYWRFFGIGIVLIRRLLLPAIRREAERRYRSATQAVVAR